MASFEDIIKQLAAQKSEVPVEQPSVVPAEPEYNAYTGPSEEDIASANREAGLNSVIGGLMEAAYTGFGRKMDSNRFLDLANEARRRSERLTNQRMAAPGIDADLQAADPNSPRSRALRAYLASKGADVGNMSAKDLISSNIPQIEESANIRKENQMLASAEAANAADRQASQDEYARFVQDQKLGMEQQKLDMAAAKAARRSTGGGGGAPRGSSGRDFKIQELARRGYGDAESLAYLSDKELDKNYASALGSDPKANTLETDKKNARLAELGKQLADTAPALEAIDTFLAALGDRTEVPGVGGISSLTPDWVLRAGSILGSKDMIEGGDLRRQKDSVTAYVAKALSGAGVSDKERAKIERMLGEGMTIPQIKKAMLDAKRAIQSGTKNILRGYKDVADEYMKNEQPSQQESAASSAADKVRVQSPDGKTGMIPAGRLQEYLKQGYKEVGNVR